MRRKKKKKDIIIEKIKILDTAHKGKSIAKLDNRVIIVDNGVPGDICDISIYKKEENIGKQGLLNIHKYSDIRVDAKCEHFGVCGGYKWQNMNYQSQLKFKEREVINNLERIAKVKTNGYKKILANKETYYYRNKLEFTFSNKRWLSKKEIESNNEIKDRNACGFHITGMFNKVVDIKKCHLQKEPSNKIRLSIKKFALENRLSFFDINEHKGLIRNLTYQIII